MSLSANENTWSNQRSKRRKLLNGDETKPCQSSQASSQANQEPIINFNLQLKPRSSSIFILELNTECTGNRETLNQIMQYLKNKTPSNI